MATVFRILYRVGYTPWEHELLVPLAELIEGPDALPPGKMLDIGCGTGGDAIYAARHGWQVTGVDAVPLALDRARRGAREAGAQVRFLRADITRAAAAELGGGYTLLLDGGCLHGLTPAQRQRAAAAMTDAAEPGATLLIFAFGPGHRGPAPRGIDPAQIPPLFPRWDLAFSRPASEVPLRGAIRHANPRFYQLVKRLPPVGPEPGTRTLTGAHDRGASRTRRGSRPIAGEEGRPMTLSMHGAACPAEPVTAQTKQPQDRWARRSAWLVGVVTLVVAAVGLALMVWDWSTPVPGGSFGVRGFSGLWAVGFGGVGALLTRRRPGHPVGWIFAAAGMLAAVDFASFEYALAAVVGHRGLPAGEYVGWLQLWIWVPFVALITVYLPLLFPDGRLPGPGWRPAGWAAAGCAVMAAGGLALTPGVVVNLRALGNPFGVHPAAGPDAAIVAGLAGLLGCAVLAVGSLFVRARRGRSVARQQIKWLALAGCLVAATLVPSTILSQSTGTAARIAEGALMIAVVTVPAAVAVAVLRYRLYDIDRVISRTLAYAIVTGLLAGIYAGLVLLATRVLRSSSPVVVAAATLAAAALFNPIRQRVQRKVERRFNRARYDAQTTVAAFAARLKDAVDLDAVRDDLASVVQTALEPASLWVWADGAAVHPAARVRVPSQAGPTGDPPDAAPSPSSG